MSTENFWKTSEKPHGTWNLSRTSWRFLKCFDLFAFSKCERNKNLGGFEGGSWKVPGSPRRFLKGCRFREVFQRFLFFAWFYHSKKSGSGFWHWAENCKNNLHKKKETRAFWHRVSWCFVLIRTTLKNSRWKKGLRPFFHSNFFMSSFSELNITPHLAKNSRFLDFRFFVYSWCYGGGAVIVLHCAS